MAGRQEIRVSFNKAKREIDRLDDAATDLYRLSARKYNDTLEGIARSWKGENANAFIRKGSQLSSQMTQTALDLADIIVEMRRVLDSIYNAEMKALDIAQNREY